MKSTVLVLWSNEQNKIELSSMMLSIKPDAKERPKFNSWLFMYRRIWRSSDFSFQFRVCVVDHFKFNLALVKLFAFGRKAKRAWYEKREVCFFEFISNNWPTRITSSLVTTSLNSRLIRATAILAMLKKPIFHVSI